MAELMEYTCPCCGGKVEWNAGLQTMQCPYCDTTFDVETLKAYDEELKKHSDDKMNWETQPKDEWTQSEITGMRVYSCNTCGGQVITDENTAAQHCPYCDNPIIMKGNLSGELKPDYVIPFKLDKNAAKEGFKRHLTGKRLLPKVFKDENHIDEIKGIYVPFWLFDATTDASISYRATKIRYWSDSKYDYTQTSYYSAYREGNLSFGKVPVDGSSKMPDDLMESIEPYDFSEAVDFQTAYLSGYFADKYDVVANNCISRANSRIKTSTETDFKSTVTGYNTVTVTQSTINLSNSKAQYALYPVWILNTTWNGNKYIFAMNGQTGKFVGNLPLDKSAYWRWFWTLFGAVGAGTLLLTVLFWLLFM